jgi:hypothetical protein
VCEPPDGRRGAGSRTDGEGGSASTGTPTRAVSAAAAGGGGPRPSKVVDYMQQFKSLATQLFRGGPFDSLDEEDWFTGQPLTAAANDPDDDPFHLHHHRR